HFGRNIPKQGKGSVEMLAGFVEQFVDRGAQTWGLPSGKDFVDAAAVFLQELLRNEQLSPRGIVRQRDNDPDKSVGEPGVSREMVGLRQWCNCDTRCQRK